MRLLLAASALALVATPAHAERFAIACDGLVTSISRDIDGKATHTQQTPFSNVYVVDLAAKRVGEVQSLPGGGLTWLSDGCYRSSDCRVDITPATVSLKAQLPYLGNGTLTHTFLYDRQSGKLTDQGMFDLRATV